MLTASHAPGTPPRAHRVRELVCTYRPLRDHDGRVASVPTLALSDPRTAATTLGPLLGDQLVEVFAVACLSTKHRLLAWHVLSRGTRSSTSISIPDVFVPACLTPGTTALIVIHNHPSGAPTPSPDDARLTLRLCAAADVLEFGLLDHVIVGEGDRYYSFREAGAMNTYPC
jgi:DNA repair protein RadC